MRLTSRTCMCWVRGYNRKVCSVALGEGSGDRERGNTTQEENERAEEEGVRFSQPVVSGRQE